MVIGLNIQFIVIVDRIFMHDILYFITQLLLLYIINSYMMKYLKYLTYKHIYKIIFICYIHDIRIMLII